MGDVPDRLAAVARASRPRCVETSSLNARRRRPRFALAPRGAHVTQPKARGCPSPVPELSPATQPARWPDLPGGEPASRPGGVRPGPRDVKVTKFVVFENVRFPLAKLTFSQLLNFLKKSSQNTMNSHSKSLMNLMKYPFGIEKTFINTMFSHIKQ